MTRDPLARMDVDTHWPYHRKVRQLQARYPDQWPAYWCAYLALLGEAWAKGNRKLTLGEAWCPALPCTVAEATSALIETGIVDRAGRVPRDSWREWFEPVADRLKGKSDAGQKAAHKRWHVGPFESCALCKDLENRDARSIPTKSYVNGLGNEGHAARAQNGIAAAMRTHSERNAPRPPRHPRSPRTRARGEDGSKDPSEEERAHAIARAKAKLNDPGTSDDVKAVAAFQLRQLGAPA